MPVTNSKTANHAGLPAVSAPRLRREATVCHDTLDTRALHDCQPKSLKYTKVLALAGSHADVSRRMARLRPRTHSTAPKPSEVLTRLSRATQVPGLRPEALLHELPDCSGFLATQPVTRLFIALSALRLRKDAVELDLLHEAAQGGIERLRRAD